MQVCSVCCEEHSRKHAYCAPCGALYSVYVRSDQDYDWKQPRRVLPKLSQSPELHADSLDMANHPILNGLTPDDDTLQPDNITNLIRYQTPEGTNRLTSQLTTHKAILECYRLQENGFINIRLIEFDIKINGALGGYNSRIEWKLL